MKKNRAAIFFVFCLLWTVCGNAKEKKDTLFSAEGDRVIVSYSLAMNGGQMTASFTNVQKKLSERHLKKYKKLDEVAVVIFDRTGNYRSIKFDGIAISPFMVPAEVTYSPSPDGYFLLQDNPTMQFTVSSDEASLSVPLYLAHYEGKHHYKVFAQCGTLQLNAKSGKGGAGANSPGVASGQSSSEVVVTSEELIDEGMSPADEAAIRINSLKQMLERATKAPFSEELTHEASMLRELRFKITDDAVSKQIGEALAAYDDKKQQLEQEADASLKEANEKAAADAQQAQARQDSIAAAQAQQASDDKKNMMWLIGGLGGLFLLFTIVKQVYQEIKTFISQKKMKEAIKKAQEANKAKAEAQLDSIQKGMSEAPTKGRGTRETPGKAMKESEAAKQRLREILAGKKGQAAGTEVKDATTAAAPKISITPGRKPSMNDQIPSTYKRLQKSKKSGNGPSSKS